jgi:uncharacterized membrane protein (DUF485 family)
MSDEVLHRVKSDPVFSELVRRKTSLGWTLTFIMLGIYFGFILVLAFTPSTLASPLFSGGVMSIGIPIGVLIILSAFVLTGIYVRKANTEFDQLNHQIVEAAQLRKATTVLTPLLQQIAEEAKQ